MLLEKTVEPHRQVTLSYEIVGEHSNVAGAELMLFSIILAWVGFLKQPARAPQGTNV